MADTEIAEPTAHKDSMLKLRGTLTYTDGLDERPVQFEVLGLPAGRGALITLLSGVWKVLRIRDGRSEGPWSGSFDSAEAALRWLGYAARKVGQYAAQKIGHLRAVHFTWF